MVGRAAAFRLVPVKARRNSFAGLVELIRFAAAGEAGSIRPATDQQTMPGSVRQSASLDRDEPKRLGLTFTQTFLVFFVGAGLERDG